MVGQQVEGASKVIWQTASVPHSSIKSARIVNFRLQNACITLSSTPRTIVQFLGSPRRWTSVEGILLSELRDQSAGHG